MLVPLSNEPRDYAWGSTTLIAQLEGREPSGRPEAEVWFGDHPADPSVTPDGRTLDVWLAEEGAGTGSPERLPYLLKLLGAASPLSIQAHPSKTQAEAGFAREEGTGIARDAAERTYRDANHKPELIVALSDEFRALAGLRETEATLRLLEALGEGAAPLTTRLTEKDASLPALLEWVLSADAAPAVRSVIAAAAAADSDEFAEELALARAMATQYPGDPGVVVALLMNLVTLRRGEALFLRAGVLHAYLSGLGVELMAASDNVVRGGLTPKHIDVAELVRVLDPAQGEPPIVLARAAAAGVDAFHVPVEDFALERVRASGDGIRREVRGPVIALATSGAPVVTGAGSAGRVGLRPGEAVLVTPDEQHLVVSGAGELFLASPGAASADAPSA